MRTPLLALMVLIGGLVLTPVAFGGTAAAEEIGYVAAADEAQQQPPSAQIDVDIDRDGGAWYTNPVWIAIGVIAVVVLILLIVMATRGGGTTIVRD